ncbi:MAG: hypothetical protein M3Y49_03145 [Actinomycetota bacterium]|nr:hypothetical protein [Actinomycetota bacterium]
MLRRTKLIGSGALIAAVAGGAAVPAFAATTSPTSATTSHSSAHHHKARHGLAELGLHRAVIAKDAGTNTAGLKAGRKAGLTLTQIAASHGVSNATFVSRLDATADARITTLINHKLPAGRRGGHPHARRTMPGIRGEYKSLANTLKLTPRQLTADLKKGQTLQQIATTQKISTSTLLASLDKGVNTKIAKAIDRVPHIKTSATSGSTSR